MIPADITVIPLACQIASDDSRWQVQLEVSPNEVPVIVLAGPALRGTRLSYLVTDAINALAEGRGLVFGQGKRLYRFSPVALQEIVKEAVARTPKALGHFRATWEPEAPF